MRKKRLLLIAAVFWLQSAYLSISCMPQWAELLQTSRQRNRGIDCHGPHRFHRKSANGRRVFQRIRKSTFTGKSQAISSHIYVDMGDRVRRGRR